MDTNRPERIDESGHQDAIGLETKPELMDPADNPQEDTTDTLEPDKGTDTDDTEPGTNISIGNRG